MTETVPLDVNALVQPIPGELPAGKNLRYEPIYDELRELRREDDALAPRGVWRSKLKTADWPVLVDRARSALIERSKDLQIAAWLTEALTARHGLAGTASGFAVLAGLVARFWSSLWPAPGEDPEEDARLAVLEWLDGKLAERLLLQPIASIGELPVSWHEQASLQRRRAGAQGRLAPEDKERGIALAKAIAATPSEIYRDYLDDVDRAAAALEMLLAALRAASDAAPPAFVQLRTTFATMEAFLRAELTGRGVNPDRLPATVPAPIVATVAAVPNPTVGPAAASGPIGSRDAAYRQLEDIAFYLETLEPHSPVPALLRRAVGWGQMRLPELLTELMREEGGPLRLLRISPSARGD